MATPELGELDIHLAEYLTLRSEAQSAVDLLERYMALYLTAFVALVVILLRQPDEIDFTAYAMQVRSNDALMVLALLAAVLNTLVCLRIIEMAIVANAKTQYLEYQVKPRIAHLTDSTVLNWSRWEVPQGRRLPLRLLGYDPTDPIPLRRLWLVVRRLPMTVMTSIALGGTLFILVFTFEGATSSIPILVLYVSTWWLLFATALVGFSLLVTVCRPSPVAGTLPCRH